MTDNIISFDFNGVKVLRDSNTKLIRLTVPDAAGNGNEVTFHNSADDSNYQVPTGKKATIIYIENFQQGSAGDPLISYTDDADGSTNAVTLFNPGNTTAVTNQIFISAEIPADKYIGVVSTSLDAQGETIIYIVEENA